MNAKSRAKKQIALAAGISMLIGVLIPYTANAEDTFIEATESTWGTITKNDGFDKTLTIYKDGDNVGISDYGDDITYTIEIQCTKKKLAVMVYSDPIGIYPSTTFTSIDGYVLTKIDSGKIVKHPYIALRDSSGIQFKTPKPLTTAILKGKNTFSFKIPSSIQNDTVANFFIGDLLSYAAKFKSLGCPLK
jgi:hypothetical protein